MNDISHYFKDTKSSFLDFLKFLIIIILDFFPITLAAVGLHNMSLGNNFLFNKA